MLSSSSSDNATTMTKNRHQDYHDDHRQHYHHHHNYHRRHKVLFYGLNNWLWTTVLLGLIIVTVSAKDENSLKPSPASTVASSLSPRDEIYIDDEGLEGSGRGGPHDDLEKDHDFSGSGFGPDDEDSDSDYHHHSHTHTDRNNNQQSPQGKVTPTSTHRNDDEDFDLDGDLDEEDDEEGHGGPLLHGSGDGGLIDHGDDDDDHTGDDDDIDEDRDIITSTHQVNNLGGLKPTDEFKPIKGSHNDEDDDDFGEIDTDVGQPIDGNGAHKSDDDNEGEVDKVDENAEEDYETSKGTEDDESPIYTDITDPTSTGSSSSSSSPTSTSTTADKRPGGSNTQGGTNTHDFDTNSINSLPPETKIIEQTTGNEVLIMNANDDDRTASFFAQPGILAAVIGGAVVGLLCAILVVMFIVYRMRKKDEGSYALDEPKRSPAMNSYAKNATNREFYA